MSPRRGGRKGGGLLPGLILITVGTIFLLERVDLIPMGQVWLLWPLFVIWIGLMHLLRPEGGRRSIFLLLIGIWLQISTLELFGLDFGDSWPLAIIAVGASMIFDTLINRRSEVASRVVFEVDAEATGGPGRRASSGAGGTPDISETGYDDDK